MPDPAPITVTTHSAEETRALAASLAPRAVGGTVIALRGELGAGKTQFAKGIVAGLGGVPETVLSPTFVILHEYETPAGPVWHIDAYRLTDDPFEAEVIGLHDLIGNPKGVTLIEWPDRLGRPLPEGTWNVDLAHAGGDTRVVTVLSSD